MQVQIKDIDGNQVASAVGSISTVNVESLVEDDFIDVIINGQLELHIKRNDTGYSILLFNKLILYSLNNGIDIALSIKKSSNFFAISINCSSVKLLKS